MPQPSVLITVKLVRFLKCTKQMGLRIHSLGQLPATVEREYYVYLLDYGWHEPLGVVQRGADAPVQDAEHVGSQGFRQIARLPSNQVTATSATRSAKSKSPRRRDRLDPHSQRIVGRYTCIALVPEFPPSVIPPPGRKILPPITALPLRPWTAIGRSGNLVQRSVRGA